MFIISLQFQRYRIHYVGKGMTERLLLKFPSVQMKLRENKQGSGEAGSEIKLYLVKAQSH